MRTVFVALLALLIVVAVAAVIVRERRRRRALRIEPQDFSGVTPVPGPPPRGPPLPVVLVHGLFGFDRIGVPGVRLHYFRGIAKHLGTLGCHAHAVRLPRMGSVPARAQALVAAIEALGHDRVDIIAHSLGGLDARYAITHLGLASRVRTLVTIGTPHRGTPLADVASWGPVGLARKAIGVIGLTTHALDWLSPRALEKFNTEVPDVVGVRYACVVGGIRQPATPVALALSPVHSYLRRVAGPNDGLVPISSQYWGETLAEIEADHWEQIGWRIAMRGNFDALGMYAFVVARLGDAPGLAKIAASG